MRLFTPSRLCLGASILLAAPAAFADSAKKGPNQQVAPAMQIQIDQATGRKMAPGDIESIEMSGTAATTAAPIAKSGPALPSQTDVTHHENGMISATLGEEHLKYLVMTVDKDGNRTISHQSAATVTDANQANNDSEER